MVKINSKSLENGVWLYLLQAFNTIIPLITLPYVTRVLGADGYGTFSIALNIVLYLQVVVEYGFGMSATREVAISDKSQNKLNILFTTVLYTRLFLYFISILIALLYLILTKATFLLSLSMMVMVLCLFGYCVQQNWVFQGMQEMKYISLVNIVSRSISTILIFIFVKDFNDIVLYSFLYSISPLLSGIIGLIVARKKYRIKIVKVSFNDVTQQAINGWYVFTTQLSAKVFGAIGITFLGLFSTESIVGIYSAIQKIPNIILLAWSPISQVLYPITSQEMALDFNNGLKKVNRYRNVILPIFIVVSVIIAMFSKNIVKFAFGKEYTDYFYWVIPLLLWLIISIANNFIGVQTLLASGKDKEYSFCFQISVVFTILINFILVYFYGGNGAAVAPVISETILFVLLNYYVFKFKNSKG